MKNQSNWIYGAALLAGLLFLPSLLFAQTMQSGGKNWQVGLTTQLVHDTNVSQASDIASLRTTAPASLDDTGFNWSAFGKFAYNHNDKLRVTFDYDINMTKWGSLSRFDTLSQMFGVKPTYKLGDRWLASLQYFFIWNHAGGFDLGNDTFSLVQFVSPSLIHLHPKWGMTQLSMRYSYSDNKFTATRDTHTTGFQLDHMYRISRETSVGGGYGFRIDNTQSQAFDRDIHDFKIRAQTVLPWQIGFSAQYKFSYRDYKNRLSTSTNFRSLALAAGEREDAQHNFTFGFQRTLFRHLGFLNEVGATVRVSHRYNESNFNRREYQSTGVLAGLTANF